MFSRLSSGRVLVAAAIAAALSVAGARGQEPAVDVPGRVGLPADLDAIFADLDADPALPDAAAAAAGAVEETSELNAIRRELAGVRDALDREMIDEETGLPTVEFPDGWPDLLQLGERLPIRDVLHPPERPVPVVLGTLSVTTVQLAPDERIVDCVVGDAVFFELQCGDNLIYIKARFPDRRTRMTVSTLTDRLYAFDLFATDAVPPDHILRVYWPPPDTVAQAAPGGLPFFPGGGVPDAPFDTGPDLPPIGERESSFRASPAALEFEPAGAADAILAEIEAAEAEIAALTRASADEAVRLDRLRDERLAEWLQSYPQRIETRYRLSPEIQSPPLSVSQIWTDGRFTYLRSYSQESPAIYEITGVRMDEEIIVNYDLAPNGLYVIDHVVDAGFAQLHGSRGEWYPWEVPPLEVVNAATLDELPRLTPEWRRTMTRRSWFVRHPRLTKFLVTAGAVYTGLGFLASGDRKFCPLPFRC